MMCTVSRLIFLLLLLVGQSAQAATVCGPNPEPEEEDFASKSIRFLVPEAACFTPTGGRFLWSTMPIFELPEPYQSSEKARLFH